MNSKTMKTTNHKVQRLLLAVVLLGLGACTGDFEEINRNPNQVTEDQMEALNYKTGTKFKSLQSLVIPVEEHMYQFNESLSGGPFGGYIGATVDTWQTKFETYNPSADWRKWPFANVITETYTPYKGIVGGTDDEVAVAFAKLLRVAIMQRVTDSYGPIPYSKLESNESVYVEYDSQEAVYTKMFEELDEVLAVLHANEQLSADAFRKFDYVYYGDILKWIKYTNSLKLRMAMRLTYVPEMQAEIQRIAEGAVTAGVMMEINDNAFLKVEENRVAMIFNDWNDQRAGADIISYMNGYKDPRREKMFTTVKMIVYDENFQPQEVDGYAGIRIGIDVTTKDEMVNAYSIPIISSTSPFLWMNAAEITFLRSEGALRGWNMGGEAKDLYNMAIALSFEQYGLSGSETYAKNSTDTPEAYNDPTFAYTDWEGPRSTITIAWEDGADNFERNLERIITQKWIANFPLGVESWSEFRRTGYPHLMPVIENKSGGSISSEYMIRRLWYPPTEYTENLSNINLAIGMLGGPDNGGTRLWWDKKSYLN